MTQNERFAVAWYNTTTGEHGVSAFTERYEWAVNLATRLQGSSRNGRAYYVTSEADVNAISAAYGSPFAAEAQGAEAQGAPAAAEAAEAQGAEAQGAPAATEAAEAQGTEAQGAPAAAEAAEAQGTEAHGETAEGTTTARLIADLENAITLIRSSKATYNQAAAHLDTETGKEYMLRAAAATLAHAASILREKSAQIDHCAYTIEDQAEAAKATRQRAKRQQPRIY
jgi:hypothetical protein